jgi:hypothetical protein
MRRDTWNGIHVDTDAIHEDVRRSVNQAMEELHVALEGLHDLPLEIDIWSGCGQHRDRHEERTAARERREEARAEREAARAEREGARATREAAKGGSAVPHTEEQGRRADDATHDILQALERGDISVDEALERLR